MTQQQWNDYYNGIAAQDYTSTVTGDRAARKGQHQTSRQVYFLEDDAQQQAAQQAATWEVPQSAVSPWARTQQYQKEGSFSSESSASSGTRRTGAALRYVGFAFIALLSVVLIVVILVGAEGWPFTVSHASSGKRKGGEMSNNKENNVLLVGKRSRPDELLVPGRVAKLRKGAGDNWHGDKKAASKRRGKGKQSRGKDPCGPVKFTYCTKGQDGFFYNKDKRDCQYTQDDGAMYYVCPRSKNRFTSQKACEHACVKRDTPLSRCLQKPVFMGCARVDVKQSWWYRNDSKCVEWDFRKGRCAFKHREIARTLEECQQNCVVADTNEVSCTEPTDIWCSASDLKFSFFAFPIAKGSKKLQCLPAYQEVLSTHSCLTGLNRFKSLSQCRKTCVKSRG